MRRFFSFIFVAVLVCTFTAGAAGAITNGELDRTAHPQVGLIYAEYRPERAGLDPLCTGTLVSARVVLTAGHCVVGMPKDMYVSFAAEQPSVATPSNTRHGKAMLIPGYSLLQNDHAVVILDKPVNGVAFGKLPYVGQLDAMKTAGQLTFNSKFLNVGFGAVGVEKGSAFHQDPISRRRSVSYFMSLQPVRLTLSQNTNRTPGAGGTCNGDSGGPMFIGTSLVIAATVTYGDAKCGATNVGGRVDRMAALKFVNDAITANP